MPLPLQIVFHQLDPWPGAEALLRERVERLERFCPDLLSCRIVVEETQKHHQLGRPVAVRVEVRLPGHDLSVNRQHDTDFKVAAREAFEAMARRVEDVTRRRREQGMGTVTFGPDGAPITGATYALPNAAAAFIQDDLRVTGWAD